VIRELWYSYFSLDYRLPWSRWVSAPWCRSSKLLPIFQMPFSLIRVFQLAIQGFWIVDTPDSSMWIENRDQVEKENQRQQACW